MEAFILLSFEKYLPSYFLVQKRLVGPCGEECFRSLLRFLHTRAICCKQQISNVGTAAQGLCCNIRN